MLIYWYTNYYCMLYYIHIYYIWIYYIYFVAAFVFSFLPSLAALWLVVPNSYCFGLLYLLSLCRGACVVQIRTRQARHTRNIYIL